MYWLLFLCAYLTLCQGYAIPVGTVVHPHPAPLILPHHSYGFGLGHGVGFAKPLGHHILKRSPYIPQGHLAAVPVGHLTAVAPLAVSHHSRVDLHSAPAVVAPIVPVVKEIVTPLVQVAPVLHKPLGHLGGYGPYHPHGHY